MASAKTIYFIGSDGKNWEGANNWNKGVLTGTAQILPSTENLSVYFAISVQTYYIGGWVQSVSITIGGNTYILYKTPGGFGNTPNVSRVWNVPSSLVQELVNGGEADMTIEIGTAFGLPGSSYDAVVTAYIQESFTTVSQVANLTVTASASGSPLSGVPVELDDSITGQSYETVTDQNGVVEFGGLQAGDTVTVTVNYQTFQQIVKSLTLQSGTNNAAVSLVCQSGYNYCGGGCVQNCGYGAVLDPTSCSCTSPIIGGVFTGLQNVLYAMAIAGVVLLGGYAVVKLVPSTKRVTEETRVEPTQKLQLLHGNTYVPEKVSS